MTQEIKATIYYFLIALVCFSASSYGVYIANTIVGIYSFSLTFITIPLMALYFITKQIFPKKINNV